MAAHPIAPARRKPRRSSLPALVLALSLLASLAVAAHIASLAERRESQRFDNRVRSIVTALEHRLESYTELLRLTESMLQSGPAIDADELGAFVDGIDLEDLYPGVHSLGFVILRTPEEGAPEAAVFDAWRHGGDDAEIAQIAAFLRREPAPGEALASAAEAASRRRAMRRALESGDIVVSDRVELRSADGSRPLGVLLYLPLRRQPRPAGADTDADADGLAYAALLPGELVSRALAGVPMGGLEVRVFASDTPRDGALLFATGERTGGRGADEEPRFGLEREVAFADRQWSVKIETTPRFTPGAARTETLLVLLLGLGFATLLFLSTRSLVRARAAAERHAGELHRFQEELRQSGEQYRRLVEVSPEATYLVRGLRFAFANSAGIELLGARSAEDLLGRPIADYLLPEDRPAVERALRAVESHRDSAGLADHRWRRPDGEVVQVELAAVRTTFDGQPAAQMVLRDVTERRRQEEELHRLLYRQRRDRDELETMHRIGRILSAELDVERLRSALAEEAAAVLGARFGAFVAYDRYAGERFRITTASADIALLPAAQPLLERVLEGGKTVVIADLQTAGELEPMLPELRSFLGAPVVSRSGEVLGGMVFGHPQIGAFNAREVRILEGIAAQGAVALDNANLYLETAEARSQAEAASRSKDEFLATLSHELRTPLAAIVNWAQVLLRGQERGERLAQGLQTILRNARMQAQLMDDLLDVSRIVSGKMRLRVEAIDLPEVIDSALESIRPAAEARGIQLSRRYDPRAGAVRGDADRLQQVVWNLLSNAVKFTPSGGLVEARLERSGDSVEIHVRDNGIGIRAEFLPRVFDRFRQLDSSIQRQRGGLGLGLSIVRHLTELHGGTVRVESEGADLGSTFIVALPLAATATRAEEEREVSTSVAIREPPGETSGEHTILRGISVLVVDDEPDAREALRQVLELLQAEVYAAGSAAEALDLMRRHRPAVLLSDIAMPGEDGYALIRKVRALPPTAGGDTPAAAITAFAYPEDRQRALDAGFQLHIAKPVDVDELADAVIRLAGRSAMVDH